MVTYQLMVRYGIWHWESMWLHMMQPLLNVLTLPLSTLWTSFTIRLCPIQPILRSYTIYWDVSFLMVYYTPLLYFLLYWFPNPLSV